MPFPGVGLLFVYTPPKYKSIKQRGAIPTLTVENRSSPIKVFRKISFCIAFGKYVILKFVHPWGTSVRGNLSDLRNFFISSILLQYAAVGSLTNIEISIPAF